MAPDPLLVRAREAWRELSGVSMAFPAEGGVDVEVSAGSLLCPPGWVGIVALGDAAVVTVPSAGSVGMVRAVLRRLPVAELTDAGRLRALLPVADVLGPASLAYLDRSHFRPAASDDVPVAPGEPADLAALLASVPADDADECGLTDITSRAFVARRGGDVLAAAGYRHWPGQVAHLSVLTGADHRGRGLARAVASAAVADALANRMLPQWRARPEPSRRVARALGFRRLGAQLSISLTGE
ncbi:GNAT family N-acetyltransferase [Micromonospora sp. WMMC241]|uniref:GNAT family N-acetyltransferase n=1 Tax=Micromonospora sp. WMMC241 TaxID=3015159 RepID=UPI0022B640A4|nr:GNAT family N-acetyltransferase [Micromonospora sp. WMMC241]MCZ7438120.1 GNAT family N-acetyltransferase [Micromonospora sp. WMMC241]